MPDPDADTPTTAAPIPHRGDKVENPQQYTSWREYAFSDQPEEERKLRF